jgi:hypothetical protein
MFIKLPGGFIDRVDHYSPDADNVRGLLDAFEGIEEKCLPEASTLLANVHGKTGEKSGSTRRSFT